MVRHAYLQHEQPTYPSKTVLKGGPVPKRLIPWSEPFVLGGQVRFELINVRLGQRQIIRQLE